MTLRRFLYRLRVRCWQYRHPYGLVADGTTDNTHALQRCLDHRVQPVHR